MLNFVLMWQHPKNLKEKGMEFKQPNEKIMIKESFEF